MEDEELEEDQEVECIKQHYLNQNLLNLVQLSRFSKIKWRKLKKYAKNFKMKIYT